MHVEARAPTTVDNTAIMLLDPDERHFRIPGPLADCMLFLRRLPATVPGQRARKVVLYVHGATFPSALSIAHRLNDKSWRDALCEAGFDVWGLDFQGYGASDRYPQMQQPPDSHAPLGTAGQAAAQIELAAKFILAHEGVPRLSLISHSWGSMPAGRFASAHPNLVDRWVLFAPVMQRGPRRYEQPASLAAWQIVTLEDQWKRFIEDVPPQAPPVLSAVHFREWGERYLDSDPESRTRDPVGVKVPLGPFSDILRAWHGNLPYSPSDVTCPIAIIRGEWDGVLPDEDARALFDSFSRVPVKRDVKIARATHLMHLEAMRLALWKESIAFLDGNDVAEVPI
jgi:pimeloyl-ACP methyl ester carboxylesterase